MPLLPSVPYHPAYPWEHLGDASWASADGGTLAVPNLACGVKVQHSLPSQGHKNTQARQDAWSLSRREHSDPMPILICFFAVYFVRPSPIPAFPARWRTLPFCQVSLPVGKVLGSLKSLNRWDLCHAKSVFANLPHSLK